MLRTAIDSDVLIVTLDNPKVNAIGAAMSRELGEVFDAFAADDALKVAIIYGGSGKIFSAGWDLKAVAEEGLSENDDYGSGGFAGITERFELNKPVIAALNGIAVGAGVEIALACDLIVASTTAELRLPETGLGVMADVGGVQRLPRKIPENFAMEMLLTGRALSAREGLQFGLFNYVVAPDAVLERAKELARQIADAAPLAIQAIKEVNTHSRHLSVEEAMAQTKRRRFPTYARMLTSADHEEGPRAFAEKRRPVWAGK